MTTDRVSDEKLKSMLEHAQISFDDSGYDPSPTEVASVVSELLALREAPASHPAPAESGAVAWMTADGRIATDETKRTAMASPSRAAFNIPLFPNPPAPSASMGRVTDATECAVKKGVEAFYAHRGTGSAIEVGIRAGVEYLAVAFYAKDSVAGALEAGTVLPKLPNCGHYIAEDNKGNWHYINHANTWQAYPGPQTPEARRAIGLSPSILAIVEAERRRYFCSGPDCDAYDHGRDEGFDLAIKAIRSALAAAPTQESQP